ncbi:hypothetical protein [Streptomyces sp. NBC_01518]|uniref:hypothetical protein n=1 Tax=Streptomyces sp. NBC_01518 TaxID=2903891 RepID=UPI003870DC11
MSAGNAREPESAAERLGACLKSLYEEAKKARHGKITYGQIARDLEIATSTLGDWLSGKSGLLEDNRRKYLALIAYLEERVGRPHVRPGGWDDLISKAIAESNSKQAVGRPPKTSRPRRVAPFRYCHMAEAYRPQVLVGREGEIDQLQTLIRTGDGYLALIASAWAGKTAFLAAFATNYAEDNVDVIAYFVRRRHGTDRAAVFLETMVTQLSSYVGGRPRPVDAVTLLDLYEEAARASAERGRVLCLIVDGLDEDAEARVGGGPSIASLLPPQLYRGLRVLVSRRWHPSLPGDLPRDHPLRGAEQIPGFRPSPEAGVLRNTALDDLSALIEDPREWVHEIVGFLALADGGLSESDLIQLVEIGGHRPVPRRFDLQRLLRSVAGRVLGPADLEPDTFVLAHEELYGATTDGLGPEMLTRLTGRVHAWADRHQADGWPESTPVYLLHHYQDFLRDTGDLDRWTDFTLDHRRLLRLCERGRPDVALASLDHINQATTAPIVLAAAAASRSLLTAQNPLVPREVLRMLSAVGDVARARMLALAATDPASRAIRLIEIVQALLSLKDQKAADQAVVLAREAAAWAEQARQRNPMTVLAAELDTEAVAPRTAVALAATGQSELAIRMLRSIDICLPEHVTAVAEAASLLLEPVPDFAAWLLNELTSEAEYQTESPEGNPDFAMRIWTAVAGIDPGRVVSAQCRIKELQPYLDKESVKPTAVGGFLVPTVGPEIVLPEESDKSTETSQHSFNDTPRNTFTEASTGVEKELLAAGETPEGVTMLLTEAKERERLLRDIKCVSAVGDSAQLRRCIDQFIKAAVKQRPATVWLPHLAQAIATAADDDVDDYPFSLLLGDVSGTPLHIRALAAAARVHADAGRRGKALRYAKKAAAIAERMPTHQQCEALVIAQAFAHIGDAEQANRWGSPPHGRRPTGKEGGPYRRVMLAIEMGLDPTSAISRILNNTLSPMGFGAAGANLLDALKCQAAGTRTDAQVSSLEATVRARFKTEPLMATGVSLLHAMNGDTERADEMVAAIPDPAARGVAQATLAGYLMGTPAHLDVTANEEFWTLSVFRTLAHHIYPAGPGHEVTVQRLVKDVLSGSNWYWVLPALSRHTPEAVHRIIEILEQHEQTQTRQTKR